MIWKYGVVDQGYWDSKHFDRQVKVAAEIAEVKFPQHTHNLVFIFDQSSGQTAFGEDAMNVKPGERQPAMRTSQSED